MESKNNNTSRIIKTLLLLILLCLGTMGFIVGSSLYQNQQDRKTAQQPAPKIELTKTFKSEEHGFQFNYPASWPDFTEIKTEIVPEAKSSGATIFVSQSQNPVTKEYYGEIGGVSAEYPGLIQRGFLYFRGFTAAPLSKRCDGEDKSVRVKFECFNSDQGTELQLTSSIDLGSSFFPQEGIRFNTYNSKFPGVAIVLYKASHDEAIAIAKTVRLISQPEKDLKAS